MSVLFLCGFMGCGKSTVGRKLASRLSWSFFDLDTVIVEREGMSIPEIFQKKGEPFFRELEGTVLRDTAQNAAGQGTGAVVATGGGTLLHPETAALARDLGKVIFLDASFGVCYGRIEGDGNRPLVVNNTRSQLQGIYRQRREIYRAHSDFTVDANLSLKEIVSSVLELVTG